MFLFFKNRKGDKLISMYWFAILTIVAVGVVLATNSFYSGNYDVREVESKILLSKISDCIYYGGNLNNKLFLSNGEINESFSDGFLYDCKLDLGKEGEEEYYFSVKISLNGVDKYFFESGNNIYFVGCPDEEEDVGVGGALPFCSEGEFYFSKEGLIYLVEINVAIGKVDENVK